MSPVPRVQLTSDLSSSEFDGIVVVSRDVKSIPFKELTEPLQTVVALDDAAEDGVFLVASGLPSKKIIYSGTGQLDRDYDDVRSFAEAAEKGVKRAIKSGCKAPMLFFNVSKFKNSALVTVLGALKALYVPLEVREDVPEKASKVNKLGVFGNDKAEDQVKLALALEEGRTVCRDIGGSDPERMAAPRVEEYVRDTFNGTTVKLEVIQGQETFEKDYPCLAAVNRCASEVARHDARIIWLTYEPEGTVEKTVMLVGKGVTYDSGGADIKVGGIMAGMSRDKCGAASVAGFLKTVSILKPKNVKVVGAMAMVRNSVGNNCYVSDEIITSRAGVRMRIVNTDAEGRMAMADVLYVMKEKALSETNPHLHTLATLTGHAILSFGPYSVVMDNGPAKEEGYGRKLQETADSFGDMVEVSNLRREDYEAIKDPSGEFVDIVQCGSPASRGKGRGHQWAGAFLNKASGLDKHMLNSDRPLKYTHVDIAGSAGKLPEPTTASTVVALAMHNLC